MIHAFTCSAANYAGKVRVLMESLERHAPTLQRHWVVVDRRSEELAAELSAPGIELAFLDDFGELFSWPWIFGHDLIELATGVKPDLALALLSRRDCDLVLYLDPDVALFSPIDDLLTTALEHSVLLTPHLLRPETQARPILDHELCALRNGLYNLGFFAVHDDEGGRGFLRWWRDRCRLLCTSDSTSGAFTDQKWVDLAPLFFPEISVVRDPRFNVAPWNLNQRKLRGTFDTGFTVEGRPLGFYHFTGFDSGAHQQVLAHYGDDRAARDLAHWYALRSHSFLPSLDLGWRLGRYRDGTPILTWHRRLYRTRIDLREAFPDPYAAGPPPSYTAWIADHSEDGLPRRRHRFSTEPS